MSTDTFGQPRRYPGDSIAMKAAIDWLETSVPEPMWYRPHPPQIKVGDINYYPNSGTLQVDGSKGLQRQPLSAFQAAVLQSLLRNE